MNLLDTLKNNWEGIDYPFLIHENRSLFIKDLISPKGDQLEEIKNGDVVALIGDFDPESISLMIKLIDKKVILVPLTNDTKNQHNYFFDVAMVDFIISNGEIHKRIHNKKNILIENLKIKNNPGLILFTSGTTGRPKAILHDFSKFLERFKTPRPTLRTLNFLLFDHIGGINTLLHTMFNKGTIISPLSRNVYEILDLCKKYKVEVLPTTPTFLRLMLLSDLIPEKFPSSVKIVSYGTERMDQPTLNKLCEILPNVDFRQTFGMSELGIVRVKSEAKDSLFMKVGGEGIETKTIDEVLYIKSKSRMLGYLNAPSPFDDDGWYNTKDIVEEKNGFIKVTGRTTEVINVGGLKFMASEVEREILKNENVLLSKVFPKDNPITGQHVEAVIQLKEGRKIDISKLKLFIKDKLPSHMVPLRIKVGEIKVGHRFKRA